MIHQVLEDREAWKVEETLRCVVGVDGRLQHRQSLLEGYYA